MIDEYGTWELMRDECVSASCPEQRQGVIIHRAGRRWAGRRLRDKQEIGILNRNCDAKGAEMKTATIPSLRVDPELRLSAESVLHQGESLSSFVEQAIRQSVAHRQDEQEFIARGLMARDRARQTGHYVEASAVVERLQGMLEKAKSGQSTA